MNALFVVALWLSAVLDTLIGIAVLFGLRRGSKSGWNAPSRVTLPRVAAALVAAAAVFFAKLPFLLGAGFNTFGLLHALYLDLVFGLPIGGLALLAGERLPHRGRPTIQMTAGARLAAAGLCLPALVGVYASFIEPRRLQLEAPLVPVSPERAGVDAIRIGILADIQTDEVSGYEHSAIRRVMDQTPDIVLLPGDLFQAQQTDFERALPSLQNLLGGLTAPGGVYFVLGDVDYHARFERAFAGTNVRLLRNELVHISVRGRSLTVGGIELDYQSPAARRTIQALETEPGSDDIRLLLSHRPDPVLDLPRDTRIDLVVAGHTHGGQVRVPFVGPLITLSKVPRAVAAGGFHELDGGRRIYVSRGVGLEHAQAPRLRVLCPPEITLLTLT